MHELVHLSQRSPLFVLHCAGEVGQPRASSGLNFSVWVDRLSAGYRSALSIVASIQLLSTTGDFGGAPLPSGSFSLGNSFALALGRADQKAERGQRAVLIYTEPAGLQCHALHGDNWVTFVCCSRTLDATTNGTVQLQMLAKIEQMLQCPPMPDAIRGPLARAFTTFDDGIVVSCRPIGKAQQLALKTQRASQAFDSCLVGVIVY